MLKEKYASLKSKIGAQFPGLLDFHEHGEVDPMLFVEKCRSYYRFLSAMETDPAFALREDEQVHRVSSQFKLRTACVLTSSLSYSCWCPPRDNVGGGRLFSAEVSARRPTWISDLLLRVLDTSFVNAPGKRRCRDVSDPHLGQDGSICATESSLFDVVPRRIFNALLDVVDFA